MPEHWGTDGIRDGLVDSVGLRFPLHYSFNRYLFPCVNVLPDGQVIDLSVAQLATETDGGKQKKTTRVPSPATTLAFFGFHPPFYGWGVFLRHNDFVRIRIDTVHLMNLGYDPGIIHLGGLNASFADGHARWQDPDEVTRTMFSVEHD